jgi:hypothetical protein
MECQRLQPLDHAPLESGASTPFHHVPSHDIYIYIYIYMHVCMYVCINACTHIIFAAHSHLSSLDPPRPKPTLLDSVVKSINTRIQYYTYTAYTYTILYVHYIYVYNTIRTLHTRIQHYTYTAYTYTILYVHCIYVSDIKPGQPSA